MEYTVTAFEGDPEDSDVYMQINLVNRADGDVNVKVLLSDTVPDGHIEPVQGLVDGDVSFYLVISRTMVQRIAAMQYLGMLNRALSLTAMEVADQDRG